MNFIKGVTTIDKLPTNSDPKLLDKIDTIITIDGAEKGFICSQENPPIFIGYKNFGLPANCFYEYCKYTQNDYCNFIYNGETITKDIRTLGNDFIKDVYGKPYIDEKLNDDKITLKCNTTGTFIVYGDNLDGYLNISTGYNIDVIDIIDKKNNSITLSYITTDIVAKTPIIIKKGNIESYGKTIYIETTNDVLGTGDGSYFSTSFNNGGSGVELWGVDWNLEVFGNISSVNNFFKSSNSSTPSQGTGPISTDIFNNCKYYAYTERSGSNCGVGQYATATTSNFAALSSIEFAYHFAGSSKIDVRLMGYNPILKKWFILWSYNGVGTHLQDENATNIIIDNIDPLYSKIQFYFGESANWSGDFALSNINIKSK